MNIVLRGVRLIDASRDADEWPRDVWLRDGVIAAIAASLEPEEAVVWDCRRASREDACVVAPAFVDLHAHLREPGGEDAETIESGAAAAAAGGFADVVAMANTTPPVDTPDRVRDAVRRNAMAAVRIHQVAAVTCGLRGEQVTEIEACAEAGAIACSDDGRNAFGGDLLVEALQRAADAGIPVLVHPENEGMIAAHSSDVVRALDRPAAAEVSAVDTAIEALRVAGRGRLHLQHVSCAASVAAVRRARHEGLSVTAEVTPHHLAELPDALLDGVPAPLRKVNPPLRTAADRAALRAALRDGVITAIATDHAPHAASSKAGSAAAAAPGMIGLETAFALALTHGGLGDDPLPLLVRLLSDGPARVLPGAVPRPQLRAGAAATMALLDPRQEWTVQHDTLRSRSRNTPVLGQRLRGRVLLTLVEGRVAYRDAAGLPAAQEVAHA